MVSFLSRRGAFLGLAWGRAPGWGSGSARPGKGRRLSSGASHRAALPTQLLLLLPGSSIFALPVWPGPKPQHMGGKEPSLQTENNSWARAELSGGRGEGRKFMPVRTASPLAQRPL